ncbi:hypothetical protein ACP275_12G046600 [Erythranthe tilingii]
MDSRQRLEDAYKRKLQRIKVKSVVTDTFKLGKSSTTRYCKFPPLKFVLLFILLATFLTFLSSPNVCNQNRTSRNVSRQHFVNRWIWGSASDPRYISNLEIKSEEILTVLQKIPSENKIKAIGLLNFNEREIEQWKKLTPAANHHLVLQMDYADKNVTWESLYPEWIDEEQEEELPKCPSLPGVEFPRKRVDLVAVKLPCRNEGNWSRDVARLHLQMAAAGVAASFKGNYPVHLVFVTTCFPIPNLFTCKDLVAREGNVWLYRPDLDALRQKIQLPIGSCELALPLGSSIERDDDSGKTQREAYATILHSANDYVCGAIAAAQSIRMSGSTRDLVILVDESIGDHHRRGLQSSGWKVRTIKRIRNPKAEKDAYNEWNYSKFRLWQLTDYNKIIFVDADLLILRNIDFLFKMPQISATGNNGTLFNSGVMVIEPSNCTFKLLMDHVDEIESYNGGDQGYLNEIFTYWHRIPKHMNFLKNFWIGDDELAREKKTRLFAAEPPVLYVLHYLGNKPWMCFRDYDCNWNVDILREFASDVAHGKWWRVHDSMPEELREFCLLESKQKAQLEWDRRRAAVGNYSDGHWRIEIKDGRLKRCVDPYCNWRSMLRHWGETNWTGADFPVPTPQALGGGGGGSL